MFFVIGLLIHIQPGNADFVKIQVCLFVSEPLISRTSKQGHTGEGVEGL